MKYEIGKSYIKYSEEDGEIVVDMLYVDPSQRGEFLGHKMLQNALDYAIKENLNLALYAESDEDTMSNDKLVDYYRDFGFDSDPNCDQLMTYFN